MFEKANKKLGSTLRQLRKATGSSQEGFALALRIDRARYGRIERGELNISLAVLFSLAASLRVRPSELLADITLQDCARSSAGD